MRQGFHCLILAILILGGCEQGAQTGQVSFQERTITRPNPTSYEFHATVNEVKEAIQKAFDKWEEEELLLRKGRVWDGPGDADAKRRLTSALQEAPMHLFWRGGRSYGSDGANVLARSGNENDAYCYGIESPVGESQIYLKDSQPLVYFADFHIHLTATSPNETRVDVFTRDPIVAVGAEKVWTVHGHNMSLITAKVEPTTVEEYQILQRIGQQLGVQDMPLLSTPGTNAPVKQITKPRLS